ncbi:hypothetical protein KCU77_g83, partial [Aureobasidium melanogenum]
MSLRRQVFAAEVKDVKFLSKLGAPVICHMTTRVVTAICSHVVRVVGLSSALWIVICMQQSHTTVRSTTSRLCVLSSAK